MPAHAVAHCAEKADAYQPAREQFEALLAKLHAPATQAMTETELETLLLTDGSELLRRALQGHLDERSKGVVSPPVVDADGRSHTHQRTRTRQIKTIFGTVTLTHTGFGGRGLEHLYPLDAALNLPPEHHSHTVRQFVAEAAAKESFDEVVATLDSYTGAQVAKRQAEELTRGAAQDFNAFYEQRRAATAERAEETGRVLVMSADGKGVPLLKRDLRPATQAAADTRQPRLAHRLSKGEKKGFKRMATVAAVYTIQDWPRTPEQIVGELAAQPLPGSPRPRPEDKRVWASLAQPPEEIIAQAFEEAERRDPQKTKQWVALSDGNELQLGLFLVAAEYYQVKLTIILDLIHVLEYLWRAARAFYKEGDKRAEAWVSKRLLAILRGRSSHVAAGIHRSATLLKLSPQTRAPVDKCAAYLLKYRDFLRYDEYLAAGYPIATGVIEGACRYLVKDRMELTGARWSLVGAEAVLQLRALRASDDFEEYWQFHLEQEQKRHHAKLYAKGQPPPITYQPKMKAKASTLRLVK
ncbi:MAG: ISKra4 family transposase [Blastocatellia bacterium]